ncbi:MAG: hypothetical protein LW701_00060 [Fluviicola sp.]|jgi:hypothetical protein|nr:hypothetical protein [Fluviicola sp.]
MKKSKFLVFGLVFVMFSCGSSKLVYKKTNAKEYNLETAKTGVVMRPLMADLDVNIERKSVTYSAPINLEMTDLKNNAMQLFLETYKCDYVVDPIFTTTTTEENKRLSQIEIKLTGLTATYKKIYQVDSLPKSISQYANLNKNLARLDYYNSYDEVKSKIGLEFCTGNNKAFQIDYPLSFNPTFRLYVGVDIPKNNASGFKADEFTNYDTTNAQTYSGKLLQTNFSVGIFKELVASQNIALRLQAGVNYSMFTPENDYVVNPYYSVNGLSSLGLRFGAGIDYKLYRNIHIVGKFHTNLGLLNKAHTIETEVDPLGLAKLSYKKVNFTDLQTSYLSLGIRFLF